MKNIKVLALTTGLALLIAGCMGGTPSKDTDGDGITDLNDKCPMTKAGTTVDLSGCEKYPIDVKEACSLEKHGVEGVLATAKKYNAIAVKLNVEFRRLNVNNRDLIKSVDEALASGAKKANPMHFKGKKRSKTKLPTDYAAWRACSFAISALAQKDEAKSTWRLAVPGDGYTYP